MGITIQELITTAGVLEGMRKATPRYRLVQRFRLSVMIETLWGIVHHIQSQPQRNCGCVTHTNPGAN